MRMAFARKHFCRTAPLLALFVFGGCETMPAVPPPEAILAGIWRITPGTTRGYMHKTLTFNAVGRLTKIETTSVNLFGQNQTITETNLNLPTSVGSTSVKVNLTGDQIFDGTLNDAKTEATGKLSTETHIFDTIITTELGPATMTRQ